VSRQSTAFSKDEKKSARAHAVGALANSSPPPGPSAAGMRLLCYADLKQIKGIKFSRPWIIHLVREGRFPAPLKPGGGTHICWLEAEIDAWLQRLVEARDEATAA
jgi:predicted DNA-binding transcriptional regulator AlpA